jgi:hypothetical protein
VSPTTADGSSAAGGGGPGGGTGNGGAQGGNTAAGGSIDGALGTGGAPSDASVGGNGGGGGGFAFDGSVDGTIGGGGVSAGATTLSVDNTLVRTLPAAFHGYNYVAYWDDNQGSAASAAALRRAGMQLTRFPGGAVAETWLYYDPYKDSGNGKSKTNADQLWTYAQSVSPTGVVMFQTNPTTNNGNDPSPAKIKAWVTDAVSKNMNVVWEIGNEPDMHNGVTGTDAQMLAYYDAFNQQAQAIHQACPKCVVMGPSIFTQDWKVGTLEEFIKHCDANADAISIHVYIGNDGGGEQLDRQATGKWQTQYQYLKTVTQKPIYITEWNISVKPEWYHVNGHVEGAVNNADMLGAFASSPTVVGQTFFGAVHTIWTNWGLFSDNGWADSRAIGGLDVHASTVPMLQLWGTVMGRDVIKVTNGGDATNVNGWAHRRSDGSVQVMLINKRPTDGAVHVDFKGFDPTGHVVLVHEIRAQYPTGGCPDTYCAQYFYNGVLNAQLTAADAPPPTARTCTGPSVDLTLPGVSITVLDFAP